MFGILKKHVFPIGIDLSSSYLKMAQIGYDGKRLSLHALRFVERPGDLEPGTSGWQRWAAGAAKEIIRDGGFKGRDVVASIPSDDLFIDQIKVPRSAAKHLDEAVLKAVASKFPFDASNAMVQHVVAEHLSEGTNELNVLVMAAGRQSVDHHLAIYESAGLEVRSIGIWPLALTNSYVNFFSRRESEKEIVALLMDIGSRHSNIAICRHKDILFARMIPIGYEQIGQGEMVQRLVAEVDACCHYFRSISGGVNIQRLVFLSGHSVDRAICEKVAELGQRLQISAQMGDVLAAVEVQEIDALDVDRRDCQMDWAMAFGLSLTGMNELKFDQ